jgi:hypothetical protein
MKYAVEMASGGMIYIPNFTTICSGNFLNNLRSYSVDITDEKDL